jgi:regulator of protease activity HflC (stomatin/prohibitin superfamily)
MSTAESLREKVAKKKKPAMMPDEPIGCYLQLLVFALAMLLVLHVPLSFLFTGLGWTALLSTFNKLVAVLYGCLLTGLGACLLLRLWLKARSAAIAVTMVLAVLWVVVLTRYVRGGTPTPAVVSILGNASPVFFSRALVLVLALGIPILLRFWFLQPLDKVLAVTLSLLWLLLWSLLIISLREYIAGVVLLLSLVVSGAVFLVGLYLVSGFLLPLPAGEHRADVFKFLRDYFLHVNFPTYVVVGELQEGDSEEDKVKERVPGNRLSMLASGPGFVLTDCDHAVAVSDGFKFKGVQGPGVILTGHWDQVIQTIDLRPQLRVSIVQALTKDGIKIRVPAATVCRIDARGGQPRLGEPLPYSKGAAFRAIHAQWMEHGGDSTEQGTWDNLPRMIAERVLQDIISEYNFDDLYGPHQPGGEPPREVISERLSQQVAAELDPLGIHLLGAGIGNLEPADPQVYVKRVGSWQADWQRRLTLMEAEGQAEWLRTVERARAEAQADLILSLGRQLEELGAARAEFHAETVLNQLMVILDELMRRQPILGHVLPEDTQRNLMDIRRAITE